MHEQLLRKRSLLTGKNEVVCTLREFNDYRRDLHRATREREKAAERLEVLDEIDGQRIKVARRVAKRVDEKSEKFHGIYGICECSQASIAGKNEGKSCKCRYENLRFIDELDKEIVGRLSGSSQDGEISNNHQTATRRKNSITNPCKYENIVDYILKRKQEIDDEKRSK